MAQKYLLDTNICIFLLKDAYGVRDRVSQIGVENFAVSEITVGELFYGASKSTRKEERLSDVEKIMRKFVVLPIPLVVSVVWVPFVVVRLVVVRFVVWWVFPMDVP